MPIALVFASTNDTSLPVRRLWTDLGRYEDRPSMEALNHPPQNGPNAPSSPNRE
jgi:hypothetical protein